MGATSVTGTGPGDSHGLRKPENSSCHCGGCVTTEETASPSPKKGCRVSYKSCSKLSKKVGSSTKIRTC